MEKKILTVFLDFCDKSVVFASMDQDEVHDFVMENEDVLLQVEIDITSPSFQKMAYGKIKEQWAREK